MATATHTPLAQLSSAARAKRVAQLVKNPGTRAAVPTQYLPPAMRRQRDMNARLAQPVVPGSAMTQRDLARSAKAATAVKYGPQEQALGQELGQTKALQRDTGGWYDQYLADVAQHAQNVQGIGEQANGALEHLQAGITGLSQTSLNDRQQQAAQDAAPRAAAPADLSANASNAAAIRQAIAATLGGQQGAQNAATNTYADTAAKVVAPGQKLSALVQAAGKVGDVRSRQTALASEKGAYDTSYRQQATSDEAKNVLATQALLGTQATQKATIGATTARTQKTQADLDFFKKHGYYPRTGPTPKPKAPDTGKVNQYGYTDADWRAMTVAQRQKIIKDFKHTGKTKTPDPATQYAKDFYAKYGVKPAPTGAVNNAKNAIGTAATWINTVLATNPHMGADELGQLLVRGQAAATDPKTKEKSPAIPKQQALWVRVALDRKFHSGLITAGTADRLHHAGYSVKVLGLSTGAPTVTGPKNLPSGGSGTNGQAPPK